MYKSTNAGVDWTEVGNIPFIGRSRDIEHLGNGQHLIAMGDEVSRLVLFNEPLGTWELEAYFPREIFDITSTNSYIYACGGDGAIHRREKAPLSTSEEEKVASFLLFPNPATQEVNILTEIWGEIRLSLFALDGKLLKELRIDPNGEIAKIPIDGLNTGVYILILENDLGIRIAQKLVIQ